MITISHSNNANIQKSKKMNAVENYYHKRQITLSLTAKILSFRRELIICIRRRRKASVKRIKQRKQFKLEAYSIAEEDVFYQQFNSDFIHVLSKEVRNVYYPMRLLFDIPQKVTKRVTRSITIKTFNNYVYF